MTETEMIADIIQKEMPNIKAGTLRFWGEWFGRPYDNSHKLVALETSGATLHMFFDAEERLSISAPSNLDLSNGYLQLKDAECVRWEWYLYGQDKKAENLCFIEFVKKNKIVAGTSNFIWSHKALKSYIDFPAVEIISLL